MPSKKEYEAHISPDDIKALAIEKGLEEIQKLCPGKAVKFVGFHWEGSTLVVYGDATDAAL